jgi:HK97 family phage major capsid protein
MQTRFQRTLKAQPGQPAENGEIDLAISSEAPYERWFGIEILSHDAAAVDLSRLADNCHPLLLNHDTEKQIGVLIDPAIGDGRMLRCRAKFSRAENAQEILRDVQDGIRQLVSVGYFIDEIQEVEPLPDATGPETKWKPVRTFTGEEFEREMRQKHGESWQRSGPEATRAGETPPTFLVTRWTPFEASIVPIPADVSVGIGRSAVTEPEAPPAAAAAPITPAPQPQIIVVEKKTMEKTPDQLNAERMLSIISLGEQFKKYLKDTDAPAAVRDGMTVEAFKDLIMRNMQTRHTDTSEVHIGMTPKDQRRYSFGRALVAQATGDWSQAGFERECSQAVASILGRGAEGFFVPPEVFARDFNVGTATEAGNLKPTILRDDLYVDVLRNKLVMSSLGVTFLSGLTGDIDMPRKATAAAIGTVTEIGSATESNPTTAKTTLSPKRQTSYVEVSKQALIQSALSLENMIRDDLLSGVAVQIESQVINGTGTAPQMTGIRYTSGIGTVAAGANGGTVTWGNVVGLESACANSNAEPDRLAGYLTNTKQRGNLKQVQKGTNLPFIWDNGAQPVNGYRAAISNNVPSNLTKGTSTTVCSAAFFSADWSMGVVGLFGAPDVTVDPYTKADTGQVKITLNQFADFGIRQPAAFAKCEDLL